MTKLLIVALLMAGTWASTASAVTPPAPVDPDSAAVDRLIATPFVLAPDAASIKAACDAHLSMAATLQEKLQHEGGVASIATFRRFDDLQRVLMSAGGAATLIGQVGGDDPRRAAGRSCAGRAAVAGYAVMLSRPIYDRLKAIDAQSADPISRRMLALTLSAYDRAGATGDETKRARIVALRQRIAQEEIAFAANIANSRKTITATPAELSGLPDDFLAAHQPAPDGLVTISTDSPDFNPVMNYARDASLRKRLLMTWLNRTYPLNEAVLTQLLADRDTLARELGRPNFATLALEDKMLGTPERVGAMLDEAAAAANGAATRDQARMLARLRAIDPAASAAPLWDYEYLQQLIRKETYGVDAQAVRRYFPYDRVRDGILQLSEDLFGVDIRPWRTSTWDPAVEAYEMYDHGTLIGRFYFDTHPRAGKYGHANVVPIRVGLAGRGVPVGALVANFPTGGYKTGLMEHSDVVVFLHEYGHLLHLIFSGQNTWQTASSALEGDFIEAPSQMLENWVWDYDTLKRFAVDESGQAIPRALVEKMNASRHFAEAFGDRRQFGFASTALNYHLGPPPTDLTAAGNLAAARYDPTVMPADAHPQDSFLHLGNNSAYYYGYTWSKIISTDWFTAFEKRGLRDRQTAKRYRELVLAPGGTRPAAALVADFLGRPVSIDAYRTRLEAGR
jgi:thimet oligopeptidase